MFFIALILSAAFIYFICRKIFYNRDAKEIVYAVHTNVNEIFEGEDFFLYETIENASGKPFSNIRIETRLPDGLDFSLYRMDEHREIKSVSTNSIQSVFVLSPKSRVERRWRITAQKRGVYQLGESRMIISDIFGVDKISSFNTSDKSPKSRITVLPSPIELEKYFAESVSVTGDRRADIHLLCDPLLIAGAREYISGDPINRINWKASARMQRLMVNVEEFTQKTSFDIIFNVQSREREAAGEVPENPTLPELGISVCASIFDTACSREIPVRLITNACQKTEQCGKYFVSDYFCGRGETVCALRMLAELEFKISGRFDELLRDAANSPQLLSGNKSAVVVTSYIDEAVLDFSAVMRQRGINVSIFVTSSQKSVVSVPEDANIYYKTYR